MKEVFDCGDWPKAFSKESNNGNEI